MPELQQRGGAPDLHPARRLKPEPTQLTGKRPAGVANRQARQHVCGAVDRLVDAGYAQRVADDDARRKLVRLTFRGTDALARSAAVFDDLRAEWAERLGADRVRALEADLPVVVPGSAVRLDVANWFAL